MINRQVQIEENTWRICLSDEKQLSFAYSIPRKLSTWRNDPLWRNWGNDDTSDLEDEWSFDFEGILATSSPFQLKARLLTAISDLIISSRTRFFYFTPTTNRRGRIFSNLGPDLLARLGRGWKLQLVDDYWFYFSRV